MKDVFLSFQAADDAVARATTAHLERLGWSCWRCTRPADNVPGTVWIQTVAKEIIAAETVLLLYSEHAASSHDVFREIAMAVSLKKPVLVVRLDDSPFSPELGYLVRTLQMLNVPGQPPAAWLPPLADALRVLLHSRCTLPIDSLPDRRIKVRFCRELHRELFANAPASASTTSSTRCGQSGRFAASNIRWPHSPTWGRAIPPEGACLSGERRTSSS